MSLHLNWKAVSASLLAAAMLGACGGAEIPEDAVIIDAQKEYGCSTINVYNAGEYIADETVPLFEKLY
ncbi:MAG: hypothetical protein IKG53_06950, partial [Solobacterium sp.]|nr:hypothetical protein [Solobacterium sp.]